VAATGGWAASYRELPVLVLGAGGFIGSRVGLALSDLGARVTQVVRGGTSAGPGEVVKADLLLPGEAERVVDDAAPRLVFNLAGYGVDPTERDEEVARQTNELLVTRVAAAVAEIEAGAWPGQRMVHVGSALEYGEARGRLDEETEARATTLYGRSKLAGTRALAGLCAARGLRGVTARLFMVYGPGEQAGRLLPALVAAAASGQGIDLTAGTQLRDFTHVDDVAEGLLRLGASEGPPGQVVNLATGRLTAVRAFAECVGRCVGMPTEALRFGALPTRVHEMSHDPVSIDRLRDRVKWVPGISVEQGVERTLDALRASRQGNS
jgi:UDP-glucose 4-epimerase